MAYEDDSRDFDQIGSLEDVEQITLREAMQWIASGVGFGVVHGNGTRYTPVQRFSILNKPPATHGATPMPQEYTLVDCYGNDIPTAEGSSGVLIFVYVWSRPETADSV